MECAIEAQSPSHARIGKLSRFLLAGILCAFIPAAVMAQEGAPTLLPGGASSLTETHGDWTVQCQVQTRNDQATRLCVFLQRQTNAEGRNVLSVELQPTDDGASGVLVLPFGLAVTRGITLQVDENEPAAQLPFSTCVPAGCLVPLAFDEAMLASLRAGTQLIVTGEAVSLDGVRLSISLTGLSSALNRTQALLQ